VADRAAIPYYIRGGQGRQRGISIQGREIFAVNLRGGSEQTLRFRTNVREKNYYEILGVEPRAPAAAIEGAYWRLARDLHNRKGDLTALATLVAANEAYEQLADARKRATYNRELGILTDEASPRRRGLLRRLWPW